MLSSTPSDAHPRTKLPAACHDERQWSPYNGTHHGSYPPEDVAFLIENRTSTSLAAREQQLQTQHYSLHPSVEQPPSPEYTKLFQQLTRDNAQLMSHHIAQLAHRLAQHNGKEIVLVSLLRAGTPVGVLLHRALKLLGKKSFHYSVGIVLERGLDLRAMRYLLQRHQSHDLFFVDGWTGKGAIAQALQSSLQDISKHWKLSLLNRLVVITDLAGHAWLACGAEDILIPSALLGATVSGLVGRPFLQHTKNPLFDRHAATVQKQLQEHDLSGWYVDQLTPLLPAALQTATAASWDASTRSQQQEKIKHFVAAVQHRHGPLPTNRIKPGLGEATRAVFRRRPTAVYLRDHTDPQTEPLHHLLQQAAIPWKPWPSMPVRALTISAPRKHL